MRQFEVWWANMPLPVGRRPVLLLTRSPAYAYLNKILVAEITTTVRGIPQEIGLGRPEGVAAGCVANFDNLHTIPTTLLTKRAGTLPMRRHREAKRSLGHALGWPELCSL